MLRYCRQFCRVGCINLLFSPLLASSAIFLGGDVRMINTQYSDSAVLAAMGERLSKERLRANWTQAQLAVEAGVSKRTVERLEAGESVQLTNWIRVLRALDKLSLLEHIFPEPLPSPMQQLKMQGKARQRASSPKKKDAHPGQVNEPPVDSHEWQWGDD